MVVQGHGPGPRYGHVMALVGQRFLLTIGGNDGRIILFVHVETYFLCTDVCLYIAYLIGSFM